MKLKTIFQLLLLTLLLGSCVSAKKVPYFQDAAEAEEFQMTDVQEIKIRPKDKISIVVNCKDPQLTALFNLPYVTQRVAHIGSSTSLYGSDAGTISGYTVDGNGNIEFPTIGTIHVDGLTRSEVAALIKDKIISSNQAKDPVVTVEFLNLSITILGEVSKPGDYRIDKDQITILEAIGLAGDLTIQGKRQNLMVLRKENDIQNVYHVNLNSLQEVVQSPVYYLQQDDVIYVVPNKMRTKQSTVNGNNIRSTSFWISTASLVTSIISIILNNK